MSQPALETESAPCVPTPWIAYAACRSADPKRFFPPQGKSGKEAKAVCAECPVREECLEYALRMNVQHGVWGGLTERERSLLRRTYHERYCRRCNVLFEHNPGDMQVCRNCLRPR